VQTSHPCPLRSNALEGNFRIGKWTVEPQLNGITNADRTVHIEPKAMQVLICLAEHTDEVVTKERLLRMVWSDTFVGDDVLTRTISDLRKAFGDDAKEPRFIQTIPRNGYRLIAPVVLWTSSKPRPPSDITAIRSIAVLPFKPLVTDSRDEMLELGMADTLITRLSGIKQIIVRPTSAVRKYGALDQDPIAAGREQRVDAVLDASIQRDGERIRVTVRIMNVADGSQLWAYTCDEQCTDIFAVQDAISEKVAEALAVKLTSEEKKLLTKRYTENTDAYGFYLKGRYYWNKRTDAGLKRAIEHFQQAIKIDPNYALAYAGLADCYNLETIYCGIPPKEAFAKGKAAAVKALELDDALAEAHNSLACVKWTFEYDWVATDLMYKRAIQLDPNLTPARTYYAKFLSTLGRQDEAFAEIKRAQERDPVSFLVNWVLGELFHYARCHDQAIEQLLRTLDMDPNLLPARVLLGRAYEQKEMYKEAIAEFKMAVTISGEDLRIVALLAHAYALLGQRDKARRMLAELKEQSKRSYISPYNIAIIYVALGEKDKACEWLEKAYDERSLWMVFLKVDPRLDSLRSDPRFADMLRRVGFPS
jgi:DNA-binding winged helix-turn-helix (wHTH) protein/tetratricopeptide (TPR) repeat protein